MQKEILNVIMGLGIFSHLGYENVTANDGVVFCGGALDTEEQEIMLENLGWEWDEDNSEWYILVQRDDTFVRPLKTVIGSPKAAQQNVNPTCGSRAQNNQ